jgi:prevent-host-death family protein
MATRRRRTTPKRSVGVRELRQNLSRYLRRVEAGETLEVTEHGRPVAVLAPLPAVTGVLAQMARTGRSRPAAGDLLALGPPPKAHLGKPLAESLAEEREERL